MTDDLYERYKEALRNGHVAVLRGSFEEALAAYRIAADIAPSRALPHTSLGGVYLRLGHLEDALTEFAAAVARAPHDEGALLGQAEALTAAGMRSDAATALDHVAEIQEAAGRVPEAADTLRRAGDLEETPDRIRRQRAMLREIRFSAGDHAAEQLLARALRLRDETPDEAAVRHAAPPPVAPVAPVAPSVTYRPATNPAVPTYEAYGSLESDDDEVVEPASSNATEIEQPVAEASGTVAAARFGQDFSTTEPGADFAMDAVQRIADTYEGAGAAIVEAPQGRPEMPAWPAADLKQLEKREAAVAPSPASAPAQFHPAAAELEPASALADAGPVRTPESVAAVANAGERAAVGVMAGIDGIPATIAGNLNESDHAPTGDELLAAAEAAEMAGDVTTLRSLLLWTARAYAREGRFEAGLDATHRLLARTPSDVDAHLVLVELYVARGWDGLAADKLRLLGRLADLNNDQETRQRLCAAASRAFPNTPSLESLCS
jgi:tetratricopeptide (TPR) repeat protein